MREAPSPIGIVADTSTIIALNLRATTRHLSEELIGGLDPHGKHVLSGLSLTEDDRLRTHWFLRMKGTTDPAVGCVDVSMRDMQRLCHLARSS